MINIIIREQSFIVKLNNQLLSNNNNMDKYYNIIENYTSKFLSYTYVFNKQKGRNVPIVDKKYFSKKESDDEFEYIFNISSFRDFLMHCKFRGIDIQDTKEFNIVLKKNTPLRANLRVRSMYKLRDYQDKYVDTIVDRNMNKALIVLQTGRGKMNPLDTRIRIPDGWKLMGDIRVGDSVISRDGTTTTVTGVFPHGLQDIYKITFEDGRTSECGLEHLWNVYHTDFINDNSKGFRTIDTATLIERMKSNKIDGNMHFIDLVVSEKNSHKNYKESPYKFGKSISKYNRIPQEYLDGSTEQRQKLLDGILVNSFPDRNSGLTIYRSFNKDLILDIQLLVRSLGGLALMYEVTRFNNVKTLYGLRIDKSRLEGKLKLKITSIEYIGKKEAQCISVAHPEQLYVVDDYVVTHNTLIALATAAKRKLKTAIVLPGYIDKWQSDVTTVLELENTDVYTIQGADSIDLIIRRMQLNIEMREVVFLIGTATFMRYIKRYQEDRTGDIIHPAEVLDYLGIGTVLADEIHEKFYATYTTMLFLNPHTFVGMTATFTSSNNYIKKFQDMIFEDNTKLNFIEINKYINTIGINYTLENPRSAKYLLRAMYNHDTYENSTILGNRSRLINFIEMLKYYIKEEHFDSEFKDKDKLIIFVSSVRFATLLTINLSREYKHLDVRRYVADDSYENILESDIIISTLGSAGTALDIPNLKTVFNTVVVKSEVSNKQSHGRLRERSNTVKYLYFYSKNIDKHVAFEKVREEQIRPYSKSYIYLTYHKQI